VYTVYTAAQFSIGTFDVSIGVREINKLPSVATAATQTSFSFHLFFILSKLLVKLTTFIHIAIQGIR